MDCAEVGGRMRYGVWIRFIEAADEHLIGTPRGVIKAPAVTTLPEQPRFDAKAVDEMQGTPWRPSDKHQGVEVGTHRNEDEDQGDEDDAEKEDSDGHVR